MYHFHLPSLFPSEGPIKELTPSDNIVFFASVRAAESVLNVSSHAVNCIRQQALKPTAHGLPSDKFEHPFTTDMKHPVRTRTLGVVGRES
jgi:hypothetical protein